MGDLPRPGESFGRYHVDGLLGRGGMGVVYLATDTTLKRPVALKVVSAQFADSEDFLRRFQREAEVMARVDSPHIVAVHDYGLHDGLPYLVSQYVAGGDLSRRLREHGPMTPHDAIRVAAQVAEALAAAHRAGVIHRDVKPSNVLLRDGADLHAYLCDFGVAQAGDSEAVTQTGGVVGSWGYLAPERVNGHPATPSTDVYAAGCLLWACLTGQQPYSGTDIEIAMAHLNAPIPRLAGTDPLSTRLNELLPRTMAKSPQGRYASADELRAALLAAAALEGPSRVAPAPALGEVGGTVVRTPAAGSRGRRTPSKKVLAGVVAAVVVLAAGGTWWAVGRAGDGPSPARADEPRPAVRGDLDGDGKGDLLGSQTRHGTTSRIDTVTWHSTGDDLGQPQSTHRTETYTDIVVADVDADGRADQVRIGPSDDSGNHTVTVTPARGAAWTTKVAMPDEVFGFFPDLQVADVDGDGRADLLLRGTQHGRTTFYVGRAGDRAFARPTEYFSTRTVPDAGVDFIYPGDFDGDGKQDVLWTISTDRRTTELRVLTSTGTTFTLEPRPLAITDPVWLAGLAVGLVYPADLDGDGADEVLLGGGRGHAFGISEVEDGRLTGFTIALKDLGRGLLPDWHDATLSDVDGDGDDDLVTLLDPKDESHVIEVYRADHDTLTGPEVWGSWECGSVCDDDDNFAFTR